MKKKKRYDLLNLIIFCVLYILLLFLSSAIYGKQALICLIIKNIIFILLILSILYPNFLKKTRRKKSQYPYEKTIVIVFSSIYILFLSIESLNCFYSLFSKSKVLITDNYYVNYSNGKYHLDKYYIKLKNGDNVRIDKSLSEELENTKPQIKVTYYRKIGIAEKIEILSKKDI